MQKINLFLACSCLIMPLQAIDNPHFYRSTYFYGEPRFEKPWLSSFEITMGHAETEQGRNRFNQKTGIFNIYGPQAAQFFGAGLQLDPTNPLDEILLNLLPLPENGAFGALEFTGNFSDFEITLNAYQNLISGFFLQAYLPLRKLKIHNIHAVDLSPVTGFPNANTPEWLTFMRNFESIMTQFGISLKGMDRFGPGDFSLLIGWARNYENTQTLDYIDVDAKIGVLFPTGATMNIDHPFTLPQGYNGHWAIPLKFNLSFGLWDWFTVGMHLGGLFFFKKDKTTRIKTAFEQNGFIKLARTKANVDPGTIWDSCTYLKADHVVYGLSILIGYTYTQRERTVLECNQLQIDPRIVNSDPQLASWRMHTIHLLGEYDFTNKPTGAGPKIGFFYNRIVAGNRIWDASMKSGYFGVDIAWCF